MPARDDPGGLPRGEILTLRFDGAGTTVWWGPDGDIDRLATRAGRILTWPSADACAEHAARAGWRGLGEEGDDEPGRETVDVEPVQAWLRGRAPVLDVEAALNLWNTSWDVRASSTGRWPQLTSFEGRCHDKLTAANVPWLAGMEQYRPRWTALQLLCLRRVLSDSLHLLRTSLERPG